MKAIVLQFPGCNRDRDAIKALQKIIGKKVLCLWQDEEIPSDADLIVVPGGFSYGDYLRAGAIAARAPIIKSLQNAAKKGTRILGICNGFQILCEAKLLPGVLLHNKSLNFACREILLQAINVENDFLQHYNQNEIIRCPIAHQQGNFYADEITLKKINDNQQIAFKYANGTNPNGSCLDIAGVFNETKNILGLMPHPENFTEQIQSCQDGHRLLLGALNMKMA